MEHLSFFQRQFDKILMFVVLLLFSMLLILDKDANHLEVWKLLTTGAFSSLVTLLTKAMTNTPKTTTTVETPDMGGTTTTQTEIK